MDCSRAEDGAAEHSLQVPHGRRNSSATLLCTDKFREGGNILAPYFHDVGCYRATQW
jgi:hypothetical protein